MEKVSFKRLFLTQGDRKYLNDFTFILIPISASNRRWCWKGKCASHLVNECKSCWAINDNLADFFFFSLDCPGQCSGKGRCVNGTCRCIEGWTGESCDKGINFFFFNIIIDDGSCTWMYWAKIHNKKKFLKFKK